MIQGIEENIDYLYEHKKTKGSLKENDIPVTIHEFHTSLKCDDVNYLNNALESVKPCPQTIVKLNYIMEKH